MVKAVSQLQDCTTLTGELSLEVIEAFKARPAYYLFDLFEFGLLLYNQRVINTWTVDVRYIQVLEQLVKPWVDWLKDFHLQDHGEECCLIAKPCTGYQLEYSRYSHFIGPGFNFLTAIIALSELESASTSEMRVIVSLQSVKDEMIMHCPLNIGNALYAVLGRELFEECFQERLFTLRDKFVQSCHESLASSLPKAVGPNSHMASEDLIVSKSQPVQEPVHHSHEEDQSEKLVTDQSESEIRTASTDPRPSDVPHLDLFLRCEALSNSLAGKEPIQTSSSIGSQSSVMEDQSPVIIIHSTPDTVKQKRGRRKQRSNATRRRAQSASARLQDDSGVFEDSFCPFEDKPDLDIFSSTSCCSPESLMASEDLESTTLPKHLPPTFIHPQIELEEIDDCYSSSPGISELVNEDLEVGDLARRVNTEDPMQVLLLEVMKEMKAKEETLKETLSNVCQRNEELSQTVSDLRQVQSLEQSTAGHSEEAEEHPQILTGAGASCAKCPERPEDRDRILAGAGASCTKCSESPEEPEGHKGILAGAGASCSRETSSPVKEQENGCNNEPFELIPFLPTFEFSSPSGCDYTGPTLLDTANPEIEAEISKILEPTSTQTVKADSASLVAPAETTFQEALFKLNEELTQICQDLHKALQSQNSRVQAALRRQKGIKRA